MPGSVELAAESAGNSLLAAKAGGRKPAALFMNFCFVVTFGTQSPYEVVLVLPTETGSH